METTPIAAVPEPPSARQPEESTAAASDLGNDERAALVIDGSEAVPKAMVRTTGSLIAEARVAGNAPESGVVKSVVPKGQTVPLEAS